LSKIEWCDLMLTIDYVYIICSENYEQDRWNKWNKWLIENSIKGEIFFYKWGTDLTKEEVDSYVIRDGTLEQLYPWRKGYPIRNSEASIGINFIKIFEDAYNKNYNRILILESDVLLHPDFIEKVNHILKVTENIDFNSLSIGCGMGYRIQSENEQAILAAVDQFRCADSLIFTRTAIEYFYKNLKQIKVPVDEEFTRAVRRGDLNVYWLEPPITVQQSQMANNTSSIQNGNYDVKIPW